LKWYENFLGIPRGVFNRRAETRALFLAPYQPNHATYANELAALTNELFNAHE